MFCSLANGLKTPCPMVGSVGDDLCSYYPSPSIKNGTKVNSYCQETEIYTNEVMLGNYTCFHTITCDRQGINPVGQGAMGGVIGACCCARLGPCSSLTLLSLFWQRAQRSPDGTSKVYPVFQSSFWRFKPLTMLQCLSDSE